jgi:hypothetical protein
MRPRRRRIAPPALVVWISAAILGACAADPGDAAKPDQATVPVVPATDSGSPMTTDEDEDGPSYAAGDGSAVTAPPSGDDATAPLESDASTTGASDTSSGPEVSPMPTDDATPEDAPTAARDTGAGPSDASTTPAGDGASPDAGTAPRQDAGDAAPPPADAGAGCAPGAMVVVMMPSGTCGNSGNILSGNGTLGTVCVEFHGSVPEGWNASNASGCSITLTGGGTRQTVTGSTATSNQPAMPAGANGYVYWNLTAGCVDYASIQCF